MFLTGMSADLQSTWRYATSVSLGSGDATTDMIEQTFGGLGGSDPVRRDEPRGRTEVVHDALVALRPARDAHPAPMKDQSQREPRPLLFGNHGRDLELDLHRVFRRYQLQQVGEPDHMR